MPLLISIKKFLSHFSHEILIVDNNSPERDIELIKANFPEINLYLLNENLGFAKANNFAVRKSTGRYLLFINADTLIIEDYISPIISFLENMEIAGAAAPMLTYQDGKYQNSTGFQMGFWHEFFEAFYLIGIYRKLFYLYKVKNQKLPFKVGWLSAACMIIKKNVFEKVNGFSEDYFLNYEDIALCKKINDNGFENYFFPALKCIHYDHKSFDSNYDLLIFTRYQSRLIYANLHYNKIKQFIIRLMHIKGIILRLFFLMLFYSGAERISRKKGYLRSIKLYLGFNKNLNIG